MDLGILWTILAAIVASQVLGALWYGPLFGKPWMKYMGWEGLSQEEMDAEQKKAIPGYLFTMVGAAVTGAILYCTLNWYLNHWPLGPEEGFDAEMMGLGAIVASVGTLIFYLIPTAGSRFFEEKPWGLWGISASYWLVLHTIYGVLAGLFVEL